MLFVGIVLSELSVIRCSGAAGSSIFEARAKGRHPNNKSREKWRNGRQTILSPLRLKETVDRVLTGNAGPVEEDNSARSLSGKVGAQLIRRQISSRGKHALPWGL
ncbi:hypothetical protein ASPBRDRAFT_470711 [Aspergillus brasiliensis CBS 101740]|uniref:Secreted protein n=1 Tax=Aspergillus brasiliensis (strain CBS 101740 / IMI 381727 / IBT 21946) TaxID=767769 RepID=A0A1L9UTD5_ASPBC|nr:hypothetical protein ASPBRDRAFT_470711 [Aspergillus brasiliensis CBS 101740]